MSDIVTVPSLMMMTLIVSEKSLARDTHTDTHTQTDTHTHTQTDFGLGYLNIVQSRQERGPLPFRTYTKLVIFACNF